MGVEAIIGAVALAVSAASAYQQNRAASRAADAQEEAQDIQSASATVRDRQSRRQQIREERIRRARILQASENTGVSGSSGQIGSIGALQTNVGSNLSNISAQAGARRGISSANQRSIDAQQSAQLWGSIGQLSSSAFGAVGGFGAFSGSGSAATSTTAPPSGGFQSEIFTVQGSDVFR